MLENYRILCAVTVLLKDKWARILTCGRQQMHF